MSSETPPPSIRQEVRIVPLDSSVTVEEVLLAVGEQVGHDKLSFASRICLSSVYQGLIRAGLPTVRSLHADHRVRCSAVHSERVVRERAP